MLADNGENTAAAAEALIMASFCQVVKTVYLGVNSGVDSATMLCVVLRTG